MSGLRGTTGRILLWTLVAWLPSNPVQADSRPADTATSPVLLVGQPDVRLLVQIRRELAASGFPVIERGSEIDLAAAFPPAIAAAVVVKSDDHVQIWMSASGSGVTGRDPRLRADLTVDRTDRHARRRVCLSVVEYLRVGATREPPAPVAIQDHETRRVEALPALGASVTASALEAVELSDPGPPPGYRPWGLGAATTLNADSGIGEPTSHVQLTAQLPLGERWAITVNGLWPLLGAQFQTADQYVRMWTLGLSGGLRFALPRPTPRLQPFLGLALGARFVLSDSDSIATGQSRVLLTPSATVGGSAGLLIQLRPLVHLTVEGNVAWIARVPLGVRTGHEAAAAGGRTAHAAVGVLFEY